MKLFERRVKPSEPNGVDNTNAGHEQTSPISNQPQNIDRAGPNNVRPPYSGPVRPPRPPRPSFYKSQEPVNRPAPGNELPGVPRTPPNAANMPSAQRIHNRPMGGQRQGEGQGQGGTGRVNSRRNGSQGGDRNGNDRGGRRPYQNDRRGTGFTRPNEYVKTVPQIYPTSNALDWGNNISYQFRDAGDEIKLKVITISGVEMIGTNCTVFEYGDDIMVLDAGLGFPGGALVGVDGLVPNLDYLADKKDKVRGLVITHGHTDHIGGIHHIIDKLGFPMIYAPKLAAGLIREKLKETPYANQVKITEIDGDSSYYLGKFKLSHFKMTHTIPDNFGVVIDTPVGRVVATSDYKFDSSPYNESPSDYSKLAKLGDEGVLLVLDESTNAKKHGWSESESDITKDMENIIRTSEGRVIIGMFSTMVNRVRQIVEIADRQGKKVAVLGRSLETIVRITHGLGYINVANSVFVPFDQIKNIPDSQLVILTTGSQGEANAALMRIAKGDHPKVQLRKTDTVVFSSSRIPGNEGKIDGLINMITGHGVRVLTNDYLTLHATGHGFQEDHKLMIRLLKPKFFMPVHGEPSMLQAHKDTAMSLGYEEKDIIIPSNGMIAEFWKEGWKIVDKIESNPLWVEGNRVGNFDPEIVEDRKILMDEGIVFVTIKFVESSDLASENMEINHRGFFIQREDEYFFKKLPASIIQSVNGMKERNKESVRSSVKRFVENELTRQYEKKPMVVVSIV